MVLCGASTFADLVSLIRQSHRPHVDPTTLPAWLRALGETVTRVLDQIPRVGGELLRYAGEIDGQEIPGVAFVSSSTRIVVGFERNVVQALAECLELVVRDGPNPQLQTLTGFTYDDVRSMYLSIAAALGT